ncbi:MAG TPA: hypothetical protein VIL20_08095, partial [Sandaracinaceae bacterium]
VAPVDVAAGDPEVDPEVRPSEAPAEARGRPARREPPRTAKVGSPGPAPSSRAPAPPAGPEPRGAPVVPPGSGPPAGVQEAVAHMARSDWRGCIRAARAAPRSPEVLGARMNCALRANDTAELRATCGEMRAHYPTHPQTQSCDALLRAYAP